MNRSEVGAVYREGVDAVVAAAGSLDEFGWSQPACGTWDATDTARHLLAVARWYDLWLDRAIAGAATAPFPESAIDRENASALGSLRDIDGPTAVAEFETAAVSYLDRVGAHWDLPYVYPFGTVTAGLHAGVAAAEWHLHAFDLASASGQTYEPSDPGALFTAAGMCVAETKSRVQRALLLRLVPVGARSNPWPRMLRESGRTAPGRR